MSNTIYICCTMRNYAITHHLSANTLMLKRSSQPQRIF